jgi:S1-C subfamily serine protease
VRRSSAVLHVALLLALSVPAAAQDLKDLQREFMRVGNRVLPATVLVRAPGAHERILGSTGVIVSPTGLILSDADATLLRVELQRDAAGQPVPGKIRKLHGEEAIVELPEPDRRRLRARLVHRDPELDVSLLQISEPAHRLPTCPLGESDALEVGAFTYVSGNSFGTGKSGKPALSAGIVAALTPAAEAREGRFAKLYTTAAVNPGNNGGPLVDLHGRLVGIISTFEADPRSPFRGFGVVTPLARILARLRGAARDFPEPETADGEQVESRTLELAFRILARRTAPSLVSLVVDRGDEPQTVRVQGPRGRVIEVPRYPGPYSAVCFTKDGLLLTTTTNLFAFAKIESITAHLADGRALPAKVVARDRVRQIALLRVEADDLPAPARASREELEAGRFVLAFGDPFGAGPRVAPLTTFGVVSAMHKLDPRIDAVQTDAGMNDANVGGPLIDLRGRLIGINLLVMPDRFGRNSGVGYAVPVWSIEKVLPQLRAGKDIAPGFLGISGLEPLPAGGYRFPKVVPDGPAHRAGLRDGDVLLALDGRPAAGFATVRDVILAIRGRLAGETMVLEVRRGGEKLVLRVVLDPRPEG